MKESRTKLLKQFCMIELQVLADREERLRKEILHCKIQREYLTQVVSDLELETNQDTIQFSDLIKVEHKSGDY